MSKEEFEQAYATASGVTVEWLLERGRRAEPCDCESHDCKGWQMAYICDHA